GAPVADPAAMTSATPARLRRVAAGLRAWRHYTGGALCRRSEVQEGRRSAGAACEQPSGGGRHAGVLFLRVFSGNLWIFARPVEPGHEWCAALANISQSGVRARQGTQFAL